MPVTLSPKAHLLKARGLIVNLMPSLDFCIAAADEPVQPHGDTLAITLAQQARFITGDLDHASALVDCAVVAAAARPRARAAEAGRAAE